MTMDTWNAFLSSSDAALVRKALDDRPEAFEQLVLRYQKKAHAVARALGVPGAAVDDVVQEAFLKAFESLPHLRSPESFGPWFLNIARNSARNCVQDLRRRAPAELSGEPGGLASPALEREELSEILWRHVAELPEAVREAVFLYYHEGESVRVVAKALGISRAAVLKRLERGRGLLRERLWRELEDSLREMLPSAREWRRKGRQLAILLLSAAATAWGIRAAPAAAAGAACGKAVDSGWVLKLWVGGIEMAAKKHGIAVGLALLMIAGGLYLFLHGSGGGERGTGLRPAAGPRGAPTIAAAAAGAERREKAAGAEAATRGAAGTVERTPSILGRVTDTSGKGVAGARVIALPAWKWDALVARAAAALAEAGADASAVRAAAREFEGQAAGLAGADTGAAGAYRLHDLVDGEYRVIAGHAAHRPRTDGWALVRAGEPYRLDLELAKGWAVAGRVVDEERRPVAGAAVASQPSSSRLAEPRWKLEGILAGWAEGGFLLEPGRTASTDDGAFRLGSLEPFAHDLRVEKEGYAPARRFDVIPGGEPVELVLSRGLSIAGRVLDRRKQPLEGTDVLLAGPQSDPQQQESIRQTSTGGGGRFDLSGLAPGLFELSLRHRGFPIRRQEVRLEKTSVDLGDLVFDSPRAIAGRVVDSRGAPIPGARVWVDEPVAGGLPGRWGWRRAAPPVLSEARTGVDGTFRIEELGEGAYTLNASSRDHVPASFSETAAGGSPIEIQLQEGATLEGVVIDGVEGSPVAGAEVVSGRGFLPDPEKKSISGPDGKFAIRGISHDDRKIFLRATHKDYPWQPSETRLEFGQLGRTVEVLLYPAERIEGTVHDAAGNPVAGARVGYEVPKWQRVFVHRVMGGLQGSARSDGDGSFAVEVPSLLRGIRFPHDRSGLELVASHPALGIGRFELLDAPGKGDPWPRVEIVLQGTSSLRGTMTDERGIPLAGAIVLAAWRASTEDGHALEHGPVFTGSSNASGAYVIADLELGSYQVEARAHGRPRAIIDSVDVGAEPRILDVALEPGAILEGSVLDDAGHAVAEAEVFAREDGGVIAAARADAGGRWRLNALPSRELTLGARAPGHESSAVQVVPPGGTPEALVLARLSSLSGVVVDAATGRPVSVFEVYLTLPPGEGPEGPGADGEPAPREFIDPRGWFRMDGLRSGTFLVAVRARELALWTQRVTLAPGEDAAVRALLERGRTLRGAVADRQSGLPIPNVRVVCRRHGRPEGAPLHIDLNDIRASTDAGGEFVLHGLMPGEHSVIISHPSYLPEKDQGKVAIGDAEPEVLKLNLSPGGRVVGKIEDLGDNWSISLLLVLKRIDGRPPAEVWCHPEPNGQFAASLPPGTYRLELGNYQWLKGEPKPQVIRIGEPLGDVQVRPGETAVFDARFPRAASRTGN